MPGRLAGGLDLCNLCDLLDGVEARRRSDSVTDWQKYGGAPILGFDRICIKAHGRSGPRAIKNAIKVANRCVEQDLAGRISRQLEQVRARAK